MKKKEFEKRVQKLFKKHEKLIQKPNKRLKSENGIFNRYKRPILTDKHAPITWRFDLDYKTNPHLLERMGINATMNSGAIYLDGKYYLAVRVEGQDRKSFFAIAESPTGVDNFRFWDYPMALPDYGEEVNVYDMRLTKHEDGWIYGVFCSEKLDPEAPEGDLSTAIAQCGMVRSKDLKEWERLPNIETPSPQQRNCVLHPELIDGKYAFYTRPQDDFIDAGSGGGIGWGLVDDIRNPVIKKEKVIDHRAYHTIKESKNGQGPAPIKTSKGWLHIAHGVRGCAAGLRYVLYMFLTDLDDPGKMLKQPGGYFMGPKGEERVGDVSNVLFINGWAHNEKGDVFIYYASSDTRMHVATSTVDKLLDYVENTPEDGMRSYNCVKQRNKIIDKNLEILKKKPEYTAKARKVRKSNDNTVF